MCISKHNRIIFKIFFVRVLISAKKKVIQTIVKNKLKDNEDRLLSKMVSS